MTHVVASWSKGVSSILPLLIDVVGQGFLLSVFPCPAESSLANVRHKKERLGLAKPGLLVFRYHNIRFFFQLTLTHIMSPKSQMAQYYPTHFRRRAITMIYSPCILILQDNKRRLIIVQIKSAYARRILAYHIRPTTYPVQIKVLTNDKKKNSFIQTYFSQSDNAPRTSHLEH